jgi:hypothetical protein
MAVLSGRVVYRIVGKSQRTSVRIVDVPAEIRTDDLLNPSLECYRYVTPLFCFFLSVMNFIYNIGDTVACIAVTMQRSRDKQIYHSRL